MEKLSIIQVATDGYGTTPPAEIIRTVLAGGAGRYRADILGGTTLVTVSWCVDKYGYQYLWAFFRNRTFRGSDPFLIDLKVETSALTEYTAYFIPESVHITGVNGGVYTVQAQLEVLALDEDVDFDNSIVDVFQASEGSPELYVNMIAQVIANWPDA